MIDAEDALGWAFIALIAAAICGLIALGVYAWQDAQDKRDCRKRGGQVVGDDWRCVMPTPNTERAP